MNALLYTVPGMLFEMTHPSLAATAYYTGGCCSCKNNGVVLCGQGVVLPGYYILCRSRLKKAATHLILVLAPTKGDSPYRYSTYIGRPALYVCAPSYVNPFEVTLKP